MTLSRPQTLALALTFSLLAHSVAVWLGWPWNRANRALQAPMDVTIVLHQAPPPVSSIEASPPASPAGAPQPPSLPPRVDTPKPKPVPKVPSKPRPLPAPPSDAPAQTTTAPQPVANITDQLVAVEIKAASTETFTLPDASAHARHNPKPRYPLLARRRQWQGTVTLAASVDEGGRVTQVEIAESSGHASLDDAAIEAVSLWRFTPATRNGLAVSAELRVPIRFELDDKQ